MRLYELLLTFPPEEKGETLEAREARVQAILKKFSVKVDKRSELGKKTLGHPIQKLKEGIFLALDISAEADKVAGLRKELELSEDVLKYMLTAKIPSPVVPVAKAKPAKAKVEAVVKS